MAENWITTAETLKLSGYHLVHLQQPVGGTGSRATNLRPSPLRYEGKSASHVAKPNSKWNLL